MRVPGGSAASFPGQDRRQIRDDSRVFIALNGISEQGKFAITQGKQPTFFAIDGHDLMMILCGEADLVWSSYDNGNVFSPTKVGCLFHLVRFGKAPDKWAEQYLMVIRPSPWKHTFCGVLSFAIRAMKWYWKRRSTGGLTSWSLQQAGFGAVPSTFGIDVLLPREALGRIKQ